MQKIGALALAAIWLSGCALATDKIDIQYISLVASNAVPGAQRVVVQVNGTEGRASNLNRVSVKKNGYGMEMAPIISNTPIPELAKNALSQELSRMGFQIGSGQVIVSAEVNKFYNDFKVGFFSGNAVSEVTLTVQVRTVSGQILYAKTLTGESDEGGVMIASGENTRISLEKAFATSIARIVSDPKFSQAILEANSPTGKPVS